MNHLLSTCALLGLLAPSTGSSQPSTNIISPGGIQPGRIVMAGQTNVYTFVATSNDLINLGLLHTNGIGTPHLGLSDPAGTVALKSGGNGVLVFGENLRLSKTGTFTAIVSSGSGPYDYLFS